MTWKTTNKPFIKYVYLIGVTKLSTFYIVILQQWGRHKYEKPHIKKQVVSNFLSILGCVVKVMDSVHSSQRSPDALSSLCVTFVMENKGAKIVSLNGCRKINSTPGFLCHRGVIDFYCTVSGAHVVACPVLSMNKIGKL